MHLPIPKFESLKNATVVLALTLAMVGGFTGGIFAWKEVLENRKQNAIILDNIAKVNRKVEVQKVIVEKLKKVPIETALSVADRIYEMHQLTGIPICYILGIIETEFVSFNEAVFHAAKFVMALFQ